MSSPVPNLPPLAGITDPNVRAYLQALTNGWQVRNGQIGDGGEKFLTVNDLTSGLQAASGMGGALTAPGSGGTVTATVATALRRLSDELRQSRLWRQLGERIERIEMPEWFKGKFGAEIQVEQIKQNNATNAMAKQLTTAVTNISNNVAIAQQEIKAVSDTAGATASITDRLQVSMYGLPDTVDIDGHVVSHPGAEAKAEQSFSLVSSLDGTLRGTMTLKYDIDGYVAGWGLTVDRDEQGIIDSMAAFRVNKFFIGPPEDATGTVPGVFPFMIAPDPADGGKHKVWIDTAMIRDATIDGAKIGTAQIGTLKLAGNAVTIPSNGSGWTGGTITLTTSPVTIASIAPYYSVSGMADGEHMLVIITGVANLYSGDMASTTIVTEIRVNGAVWGTAACTLGESKSTAVVGAVWLPNGNHAITLTIKTNTDAGGAESITMTGLGSLIATGGKR